MQENPRFHVNSLLVPDDYLRSIFGDFLLPGPSRALWLQWVMLGGRGSPPGSGGLGAGGVGAGRAGA